MIIKKIFSSIITLIIVDISNVLETQAEHRNGLINKFCVASLKSKLKLTDKHKLDEISHYTCECFLKKFTSGYSINKSRIYCKNKTAEKYNL
tara:strand:+ start:239 stop:514 length:276 start_codon:yes stop_codon:yes gene_type:complete